MLPFWPDEFTGLWALRLADGDLGRVVVVMVEGDESAQEVRCVHHLTSGRPTDPCTRTDLASIDESRGFCATTREPARCGR